MTAHSLDITDPTFVDDLRDSQIAVDVVARHLSGLGYPVHVNPVQVRPDPSVRAEYADKGDLVISQVIEVKHRKELSFTGKADFPYPSIIVDVCHTFDRARPKPYAYVILNKPMTVAFVIRSATRARWFKTEKFDRHANRTRSFYECPIEHVEIMRIEAAQ